MADRKKRFSLMLTEEEYKRLEELAQSHGMTVSGFIRWKLFYQRKEEN